MSLETLVGLAYQFAVEALLAPTRFVSSYQQNRPASWVKSEGNSPFTICGVESQFLHVCMAGTLERVCVRPSEQRTKLFKQQRQSLNLGSYVFAQRVELGIEFIGQCNDPFHILNMRVSSYDVKSI